MAGQVIMQGFIHRKVPMWVRRLATMTPAFIVIGLGLDPTRTLVLSQVVLSFALPFCNHSFDYIYFQTCDNGGAGQSQDHHYVAWLVAGVIVVLNIFLLYQTFFPGS